MPVHRQSVLLLVPIVAGTLLAPGSAHAQQAGPVSPTVATTATTAAEPQVAAPAAEMPVQSTVAVSAARSSNRIDRQAYDVKSDTASTNDGAQRGLTRQACRRE